MSVTAQKIAELAGVSRGTVDRALHNRGRVNPEVAKRIWQIAEELDYQPNKIGRALVKAAQELKLGVILQSAETPTMKIVNKGVEKAAAELKSAGVEIMVRRIERLNANKVIESFDGLIKEGVRGFALSPSYEPEIRERINELRENNIPVITLNSDIADSGRLCFIGMDNYRAGQTAAELAMMFMPSGGTVLPLTGHFNNMAHNRRVNGFTDTIVFEHADNIRILPYQACFDRDDYAYEITQHTLAGHPELSCVYVAANGQLGVCNAIADSRLSGKVKVIAFDLTPPNDELLRQGMISVLIDQDAFQQGYRPPLLLHNYILHHEKPEPALMYTDIHICTKYNTGEPIKFD